MTSKLAMQDFRRGGVGSGSLFFGMKVSKVKDVIVGSDTGEPESASFMKPNPFVPGAIKSCQSSIKSILRNCGRPKIGDPVVRSAHINVVDLPIFWQFSSYIKPCKAVRVKSAPQQSDVNVSIGAPRSCGFAGFTRVPATIPRSVSPAENAGVLVVVQDLLKVLLSQGYSVGSHAKSFHFGWLGRISAFAAPAFSRFVSTITQSANAMCWRDEAFAVGPLTNG